jgi:hypothetical protein
LTKTKNDGLAEHLRAVFAALSPAHQDTFRRPFEASLASGDSEQFFTAVLGGLGVAVSLPTPLDFAEPDLWPIYMSLPPILQARFREDFETATRATAHKLFARVDAAIFFLVWSRVAILPLARLHVAAEDRRP